MSGPKEGSICAFQRRAKAPKWRCSVCSTGRVASSSFTPAGPNEARTSSLSWRRSIVAMVPSSASRSSRSCSFSTTARSTPARRAAAARAHWLTVEWLPKYAPELNDIEALWRDLKRHHLAHQTFNGPDDLDRAIHEAVMKLDAERNRHPFANHRTAA